MVDVFGYSIPQSLYSFLLVLTGSILALLFREVVPFEWRNFRNRNQQKLENLEEYHEECLRLTADLASIVYRETQTTDLDYNALQEDLDRVGDEMVRLADDSRAGPDDETPSEMGNLGIACIQIATFCRIYSNHDGADRLLEVLLIMRTQQDKDEDLEIAELEEAFNKLPEGLKADMNDVERHVDEEELEGLVEKYPSPVPENMKSMSLFHPLFADVLTIIDDSHINRVTDEQIRKVLINGIIDATQEARENINGRKQEFS